MTNPLWLAQNLMTHPFARAQDLVTHPPPHLFRPTPLPPILIDQSLSDFDKQTATKMILKLEFQIVIILHGQ